MPRPKRTKDFSGTVIGATIGGLLGGPAGAGVALLGATLGGVLGSGANAQTPVTLGEALRQLFTDRGLVFVSAEREGPFRV